MVIHETLVLFVLLLTKRTRESNACHRGLSLISEKLPRKVQGMKALIPQ
jgi:Zn-dependent protease with chaperone function